MKTLSAIAGSTGQCPQYDNGRTVAYLNRVNANPLEAAGGVIELNGVQVGRHAIQ